MQILKGLYGKFFTWELIIFHCLSQEAMKVIKKKYTKTNCRRHTTYYYQLLLLRPSKSKGRSSKKGKIHTISCAKLLYFTKKNLLQRLQKKNLCKWIEFELSKKQWFFIKELKVHLFHQLKFNLGKN